MLQAYAAMAARAGTSLEAAVRHLRHQGFVGYSRDVAKQAMVLQREAA